MRPSQVTMLVSADAAALFQGRIILTSFYLLELTKGKFIKQCAIPLFPSIKDLGWNINFTESSVLCKHSVQQMMDKCWENLCEQCRKYVANPDTENCNEKLPLDFSITLKHDKCIRSLLELGADVNMVGKCGFPPLMQAVDNGYVSGVRLLLQGGAHVNKTDSNNYSALMSAASNGDEKCVDMLIKAEADVNTLTTDKRSSAILEAVSSGSVECVDMLINAEADVNIKHDEDMVPIIQAIINGHEDIVESLLKAGADVNEQCYCASPAILWAANNGHYNVVDTLIQAGADVNATDWSKSTALMEASSCYRYGTQIDASDFVKCGELLVGAGADLNLVNMAGSTALIKAAENGNSQGVDLLIKAGANVNILNDEYYTALMRAAAHGNGKCAELLLGAGADVNFKNPRGMTALMCVGSFVTMFHNERNYVTCSKLLLHFGAKINMFNEDNHNTLQHYVIYHTESLNQDLCMFLFAAGEKIDSTTVELKRKEGTTLYIEIPAYFLFGDLSLKHLCRKIIRKHLINIGPHQHLFGRIPGLGLPSTIVKYLLYNMSLNEEV